MAKDKYKQTTIIEITGILDIDDDDNPKIIVWHEDNADEIDVKDILWENSGKQIAIKILSEEDLTNG